MRRAVDDAQEASAERGPIVRPSFNPPVECDLLARGDEHLEDVRRDHFASLRARAQRPHCSGLRHAHAEYDYARSRWCRAAQMLHAPRNVIPSRRVKY
jgi:hypothetical protein